MSEAILGKLEQVDPRLLWTSEPAHFTPWLAANLGNLGEALGLELELVKAESSVGPFSCDIEAIDALTGRKVIIENQLEPTDHTHLGQLITYAAGLDATVIVWISPLIREQHRQAIDFLNRHTAEGFDFFAVGLEVVKIGNSLPAVIFKLVSSPNAWAKTISAVTNQPTTTSTRMLAYQEFYQSVMDELRDVHHFTNARAAMPQSWYSFSSGTGGFRYSSAFTSKDTLRAELYIDTLDAVRNKAIFDYFFEMKLSLAVEFGQNPTWDRLDKKRGSRISLERPHTSIDHVPSSGASIKKWLIENLLLLKKVFGPRLKEALIVNLATLAPTQSLSEFSDQDQAEI